eukprot:Nk52_evm3s241 gene=Nk52_evmTU3s241
MEEEYAQEQTMLPQHYIAQLHKVARAQSIVELIRGGVVPMGGSFAGKVLENQLMRVFSQTAL